MSPSPGPGLALGERDLISLIWSIAGAESARENALPHPDDAVAIPIDGRYLLLKTDMFVRRTDAPRGMTHAQMGAKAVAMNVSDLAAKGALPSGFLFSLGVPRGYSRKHIEGLISGIVTACREYCSPLLGGDTGESRDLVVAGFAFGFAERLVKRSGASPGDILAVTGPFGSTAAAYKILLEGMSAPASMRRELVGSVYRPRARPRVGSALAESGAVTSSMDSSDGLAFTINELARSSGVGFRISNIPIAGSAVAFAALHGLDAEDLALFGGEEYELVVTVKPDKWAEALRAAECAGGTLIRIGEATSDRRVLLSSGSAPDRPIPALGWEHLRGG